MDYWTANLFLLVAGLSAVNSDQSFIYKDFSLYRKGGEKIADFHLPKSYKHEGARSCKNEATDLECVQWGEEDNIFRLTENKDCTLIHVDMAPENEVFNCWPMSGKYWYGGGEEKHQYWPIEGRSISKPMVPVELENRAMADPIWYSSKGDLIYVKKGAPVFVEMNTTRADHLCIRGSLSPPYRQRPRISYQIRSCQKSNPKEVFQYLIESGLISKPSGYPDERMIRYPVWSTWAQYLRDVNESIVREFAKEISAHGFRNSQLELDDRWETCYGSTTFDKSRFPDMKKLSEDLHGQGFRLTLWTHFFIQLDCNVLPEAERRGYLVANMAGNITSKWWNGIGSVVDFTNSIAKDWWVQKHHNMMKENGIDGLKFDAGETSWLPQLPNLHIISSSDEDYPGQFTVDYIETCSTFGAITEFRSAHYTQHLPNFIRMIDKDSKWGYDNGLKTLVTTLLHMNALGYTMVLPDMIGGNAYDGEVITDELFIRWVQANTFMPALQFSVVPWSFKNKQVTELSLKFAQLHDQYTDKIIEAMRKSVADGTPVNPPIWWLSPEDDAALSTDSEFLLGEDILVAPVLEENMRQRDIYLPAGTWKDGNNGTIYEGSQWIKEYPAPLDTLPYFIRQDNGPSSASLAVSHILMIAIPVFALIQSAQVV